jgi:hypothetical protein
VSKARRALIDTPELNLALMAFLVHYPWEFLQVPFFAGMATAPHWDAVKFCTTATLGDVVFTVIAFWGTALFVGSRSWIGQVRPGATAVFVAIGVGLTMASERLATGPLARWSYSELMPVLPILGVGLVPILQWLILPPAIVWLVRRQLAGAAVLSTRGGSCNGPPGRPLDPQQFRR